MILPIDSSKADWKKVVKERAAYIRTLINGTPLFGKRFNDNDKDAALVAAFLKGVEQGRVNHEKIIAQLENPYKYVDEVIKTYNPERAELIKKAN